MSKRTNRTTTATESIEWLKAKGRGGEPRIQRLGWPRLARIYRSHRATAAVCGAIEHEARRCGYTQRTILALHI